MLQTQKPAFSLEKVILEYVDSKVENFCLGDLLGDSRRCKEWQKKQSSSHTRSLDRRIHECEADGRCCERRH